MVVTVEGWPKPRCGACLQRKTRRERTGRPVLAQVARERLAHVRQQRQAVADQALAADDDLPLPPAQVAELERDDLARAQAQAGQEQEDRVVAPPRGRGAGRRPAAAAPRRCGEIARHARKPPLAHRRDGAGKVRTGLAAQEQEAQERAQRGGHVLRTSGSQ